MARREDGVHFEFVEGQPRRNREVLRAYEASLRSRPDELAFQEERRRRGMPSTLDPLPEGYT